MLREGTAPDGRTLDVACGVGRLVARLGEKAIVSIGLEPSPEMSGLSRWLFPRKTVALVRGVAEALPFRDRSFDRVICQGSLDHFVDPTLFMRETARILRPDGRAIISLANYASLSCQIGRFWQWSKQTLLCRPPPTERLYYQPPPDHYQRGDITFVQRLGSEHMRLERCYGVSLLCNTPRWGIWLDRLPGLLANALITNLDRIAYTTPRLSDTIISVWRPFNGSKEASRHADTNST